ncbi:hypothetical protein [Streptomyces griseofuscus]|uniref:hypothetical protein n=1 Tax=Streptomyces griseofuscus TaxID=146922 RepID=UPI0033F11D96
MITHADAVDQAEFAARQAAMHAREAATWAHDLHRYAPLTAIGALWADVARTYVAIAAVLPATEDDEEAQA